MRANTVSSDSIKARALGDRSATHHAGKNAGAPAGAPNVRHLNETRRALLTEIDNAKFSYVLALTRRGRC